MDKLQNIQQPNEWGLIMAINNSRAIQILITLIEKSNSRSKANLIKLQEILANNDIDSFLKIDLKKECSLPPTFIKNFTAMVSGEDKSNQIRLYVTKHGNTSLMNISNINRSRQSNTLDVTENVYSEHAKKELQ